MSTQAQTKMRDSNIELLRIICMLFILIHHFIVHSLFPDLLVRDGDISAYRVACIIINGFVYVGVNCFILISGYFGIKFKFRSLFNLYFICAFFALITALMKSFVADVQFNKGLIYSILLPFSHSDWWFIKCYVALFLISPILNKAAQYLHKKEFTTAIVLLTALNVYLGYYWHQHNVDGYNLVQFIYIYLIGAYLHKFPFKSLDRKNSMLLYLSGALLWSLCSVLSVKWKIPHWISFYYNNPLVIIASIGLFVYMSKLEIKSRAINVVAASVLAAYLIQDIQGGLVYALGDSYNMCCISTLDNGFLKILAMTAFVIVGSIGILFIAFALDRIRLLLMRPIWWLYNHFVEKTRQ